MTLCLQLRKLLPSLVCVLFILWLNSTRLAPSVKSPHPVAPTSLQGAAALEQLKQTGQFGAIGRVHGSRPNCEIMAIERHIPAIAFDNRRDQ